MFDKKLQGYALIAIMLVVATVSIPMRTTPTAVFGTEVECCTTIYVTTTKTVTTPTTIWQTTTKTVTIPTTVTTGTTVTTATTVPTTITTGTTVTTATTVPTTITTGTTETTTATDTETTTVTTGTTETTTVTTSAITTAATIPAYVIIGTPDLPVRTALPIGTVPAAWIDATASSILEGMLTTPTFSFDTNTVTVNQGTGAPIPGAPSAFVMSGGPFVNAPVKYYEQNYQTLGTPVHFGYDGSNYAFFDATNHVIPGTSAAPASLVSQDYFLIESFIDPSGNNVVIIYGYGGLGTFAAALYYKQVLNPSNPLAPYLGIFKWTDMNGNGLPDIGVDTFTQLYP